MAIQIKYPAEEYSFLPGNYFCSLKKNPIIETLVTLREKIFQARRDKEILSLGIFYIKKAFNNIAPQVVAFRDQKNQISL